MNSLAGLLGSAPMQALGWTLIHFVWQGAALFLLHELLLTSLRRQSAASRYVASCAVLLAMGVAATVTLQNELRHERQALPATTVQVASSIDSPVGIGSSWAPSAPLATSASSARDRSAREGATPPVEGTLLSDPHVAVPASPVSGSDDPKSAPHRLESAARDVSTLVGAWLRDGSPRLDAALPWLVAAWILGVFLLTLRLALAWQEAHWLRTRAIRNVGARTLGQVQDLLRRLRISRPVSVLESSLAEVPTVVGWLRPVILVPTSALTGMPAQHLEALLVHELSHVKRHDYLVNLLQCLIETLLFYHPAVWWVSRRIREEREHCCDDVAVAVCGDAVVYARALTTMEELRRQPLAAELAMAADGGSLVARVRRLVGHGGAQSAPGAGVVVGAVLIGLTSLLAVSAARTSESLPGQAPAQSLNAGIADHAEQSHDDECESAGSSGGKIAGIPKAQPAPQLPRPESVNVNVNVDNDVGRNVNRSVNANFNANINPNVHVNFNSNFNFNSNVNANANPNVHTNVQPEVEVYVDADDHSLPSAKPLPQPRSQVQPRFSLGEILALEQAGVDADYYDDIVDVFGDIDVDEIVALKHSHVDPQAVAELSRSAGGELDVDLLLRLQQGQLTRSDRDKLRRAGIDLQNGRLGSLPEHNVDADDLADLRQLDLPGACDEDLMHLAQHGFDANDVEELQHVLGTLPIEEVAALLALGVDGGEVEELQDMGLRQPTSELLIRMYSAGLTADVIDTILDDRMDEVDIDVLLRFKELGLETIFEPEFRRRNE